MPRLRRDVERWLVVDPFRPQNDPAVELAEMPPDSTQVVEVVHLLKAFALAIDLHGIWLTTHRFYDDEIAKLHDPLSKMIFSANLYLKMPAATYDGRRFVVVIEPMLSPKMVNARIYGADVVAEGVETVLQRDTLREAGCGFAQGFLFAKPMDGRFFGAYALTHLVEGASTD